MSEKQEVSNQIGKMLGQLVEHQRDFGDMSVPDREWVIRNTPEAIALFIETMKARKVEKPLGALFFVVAKTPLGFAGEKKTAYSFPRPRYVYRDGNIDRWLPDTQSPTEQCTISTLGFTKSWTFPEAAAKVLRIGAGISTKILGKGLIGNGRVMTLPQVEAIVEMAERGGGTGIQINGQGNFFFVETGNSEDPVSVGCISVQDSHWRASVFSLDYLGTAWHLDSRLLVCNLDTSKL